MLEIKIKSTDVNVSPVVQEYVSKKMMSLNKFLPAQEKILCEVELAQTTRHHKSGDIYKVEVNMTYANKQYYVVSKTDDLYSAIDEARDEAERVIVSGKEKHIALFRRGASKLKGLLKRFY